MTENQMQSRVIKGGPLYREFRMDSPDEESRTVDLVFSTEESEIERWFGIEVLGHKSGEVDMSRLDSGSAALLMDHNRTDQVGVIVSAEIGADRKGRAKVRFGKSARAEEVFRDVVDGIRQCVSVGYYVNEMVLVKAGKDGVPSEYRVTSWQPFEISIVSVPADMAAGIGRAAGDAEQREITIYEPKTETKEEPKMPEAIEENRQTPAPAATHAAPAASVNVEEIQARAMADANKRVADIMAVADLHAERVPNMTEMRQKFINEGRTADEFRIAVLDEMSKVEPQKIRSADSDPNIGMDKRDVEQYSLMRMVRSIKDGDRSIAALEWEASRAAAKKFGDRSFEGDFQIPNEVLVEMAKRSLKRQMLARAFNTATPGAGAELVGTLHDAANFIELLRNRIVVAGLGARSLGGLVGNLSIPKQTGGATAYWVNEDEDVTASNPTTGSILFSPKTIGGHTKITRQQMLQSSPDVQTMVEEDLMNIIAQGIDVAALQGSGASGEPTGVINVSGVGSVTITTAIDFGDVVDLEGDVETANALMGNLAYVTTPALKATMKQTLKTSAVPGYIWEGNEVNGYQAVASNNAPTGKCIFGNWADLIIASWGVLDMIVDRNTYSSSGAVKLVALQSLDIGIRHEGSFSVAA